MYLTVALVFNYNRESDLESRWVIIPLMMKYNSKIDLHTHSSASDGYFAPKILVKYAYANGLAGIALTDHDSVSGIDEAVKESNTIEGFILVPGIELSAEFRNTEIHLLGYGMDWTKESFLATLKKINYARLERLENMIHKLQGLRIYLPFEDIQMLKQLKNPGRLHVARVLKDRNFVQSIEEAFQRYLNRNAPAYSPRYKLSPREAIGLIKEAGGLPVLAHPGLMKDDDLIPVILRDSLAGIEAYYPAHTHADIQRYLSIAEKHNLIVTGGSDFHAPPSAGIRNNQIGRCALQTKMIQRIINT